MTEVVTLLRRGRQGYGSVRYWRRWSLEVVAGLTVITLTPSIAACSRTSPSQTVSRRYRCGSETTSLTCSASSWRRWTSVCQSFTCRLRSSCRRRSVWPPWWPSSASPLCSTSASVIHCRTWQLSTPTRWAVVLLLVCRRIDLFSSTAARVFNKLTYLLTYLHVSAAPTTVGKL